MLVIAFSFTQLPYLKKTLLETRVCFFFLHDWNIHKLVTSTTKSHLN